MSSPLASGTRISLNGCLDVPRIVPPCVRIPEIPYDIEKVVAAIQKRSKAGKRFTILAVAEGAISKEDALLSKKDYKKKLEDRAKKYPSVSYEIADKITQKLGSEVRITVPAHSSRGTLLILPFTIPIMMPYSPKDQTVKAAKQIGISFGD